jgi:hypothetical protein
MSTMQHKLAAPRSPAPMAAARPALADAPFECFAVLAAVHAAQLSGTVATLAVLSGLTGFRRDNVMAVLATWLAIAPQLLGIALFLNGLSVLSEPAKGENVAG